MGEQLIKPYEISVWENKLTSSGFVENKLAVIGSHTMTGLNRAYNPVFHKKSNGEKTLEFSLKYRYFDGYKGEEVINPFAALLVNERRVKLNYDGEWYEFIVKDHTESTEEFEWNYTCTDAFVLELSKQGYNITFDTELNNNQGTAKELVQETIKDTDWQLGTIDAGRQKVAEPIYSARIFSTEGIEIINTDGGVPFPSINPNQPAAIYLFYSYIKNKDGKFIQFIRYDDQREYDIDDNNVITDTNFRIITELTYDTRDITVERDGEEVTVTTTGFWHGDNLIIAVGEIETKYQAYRLVYNQLTTYDPTIGRTVDRFQAQDREVYKYTDYTYTTSNVVTNFVTNGENFNILEDGTLQGWNPYTDQESELPVNKLELLTKPELGTGKDLADLTLLSQIEGFLKINFNGSTTIGSGPIYNTVYNSGIENNASIVSSISKGDKFVFRWRAGVRDPEEQDETKSDINCLVPTTNLRMVVATYTQDAPTRYGYYYKHIDANDIIVQCDGSAPTEYNNYITGGHLEIYYKLTSDTELVEGKTYYKYENGEYVVVSNPILEELPTYYEIRNNYIINNIVQTPSTKYIYVDNTNEQEYIWSGENGDYVLKTDSNYLPYYYVLAEAQSAVSNTFLTDPTAKIGIFIYNTSGAGAYYIQDIQLTRYIEDAEGNPILMGNIPTATSAATDYYYLKPEDGTAAEDVEMYTSVDELANALGISVTDIIPLYNENSEKNLTISESQSNCFNILQTIAETFECWIDLVVDHDSKGYVVYTDGKPNKFVCIKQYAGVTNYTGFKYGINLKSIERNVNSDEIVTKLIVDQSQSEYVDEGYISISNAPSNQSGESYILNFDYYYNQGLLDRDAAEADRLNFYSSVAELNKQLQEKEKQRISLENSLTILGSKRNVFTELVDTAQDTLTRALADFEELTGQSYDDYRQEHTTLPEDDQLTEEETIFDILGEIYVSSATINNYSGLLTNVEQEYWEVREQLRGSENYNVKIWVGVDDNDVRHVFVELDDFLPGFTFTLGSYTGESTVSKKFFDIESNEHEITFTAPESYEVEQDTYIIIDDVIKQIKITSVDNIAGIEDEIDELQEQKDELTKAFNNKYTYYIQEGTWNSTDYIDSELYYLDALQVSNTSAQPAVSYTIGVVEISELEGFEWYLFDVGEKTYVEDVEFFGWIYVDGVPTPAKEEVIVSEIEWHLDEPDQNIITVQNFKTQFEDFFQRINATVQTVQYNEATYAKTSTLINPDGTLNQEILLESLNKISGQPYTLTSNGSVMIDGDNILVQNLNNPANRVIINSEGIRVSSDGGQTWRTAIDGQGINIGTVYTGSLNTNNVIIGSEDNPSFRWDKSGISAYKSNSETGIYDLKTFVRYDEYGLYGIKGAETFKAQNLQDILDRAHFAVTWDGFFIKNSYEGGGRVEITSDNDFRVLKTVNQEEKEVIKIGALEWNGSTVPAEGVAPTLYGIRITNDDNVETFKTGNDGNITITGVINATGGNFKDLVTVGKNNSQTSTWIEIDGRSTVDGQPHKATIGTSNYTEGVGAGWMINADGDAVFNNITARGAIKTAVFEYAEIQAVGGIFIFRPSSTIRSAVIDGNNLVLTVEKPILFKDGQWCKVSNYTTDGQAEDPDETNILINNGLSHIYQVSRTQGSNEITLLGGAVMVTDSQPVIESANDLIGGSLVDMGNSAGTSNYGIGINSSDNSINLPPRAISLFETSVDGSETVKVSYNYRGILGTLPPMSSGVNQTIYQNMQGTQGIYTDNMYIGDASRFLAFYTENGIKKLRIKASDIVFEGADGSEVDTKDSMIEVVITSSNGTIFKNNQGSTILTCTVLQGNNDITNSVSSYVWKKNNVVISGATTRTLTVLAENVDSTAVYTCDVELSN